MHDGAPLTCLGGEQRQLTRTGADGTIARLYKRPADPSDPTRGAPDFDRRRYVLFGLACAALERAESQVTLRTLGERLLALAAEPELGQRGFTFTLERHHERRELVAICRYLLSLGVLQRVAGDEGAFVSHANELARPVLFLNLPAAGAVPGMSGGPAYLSLRTRLRRPPVWQVQGRTIFVCENPGIIAIAADALGQRRAPLVCTDGMPAAVQRTLLLQLRGAGARLCYHGDFDWPGLVIGNVVMTQWMRIPGVSIRMIIFMPCAVDRPIPILWAITGVMRYGIRRWGRQ